MRFEGHLNNVNAVDLSSDFKLLATASDDNFVRFWNIEENSEPCVLKGHSSNI